MELPTPSAVSLEPPPIPAGRLRGGWLLAARVGWLAGVVVALALFVASAVVRIRAVQAACLDPTCPNAHLPAVTRSALDTLGIRYSFLAGYLIALDIVLVLTFGLVAILIYLRRSDDRIALLVSLALVFFSTATFTGATDALAKAQPGWRIPVLLLNLLGSTIFILALYLLPDGRFAPRWTRWAALIWIGQQVFHYVFPGSWVDTGGDSPLVVTLVWAALIGSVIYSQVYRYRQISGWAARQQTKWIGFGVGIALVGLIIGRGLLIVLSPIVSASQMLVIQLITVAVVDVLMMAIPVTLAIAILRFHLFDIDTLINRTLVYGTLSACILALYAGVVSGVGLIFQTRANAFISLCATVVVILAIQPLREWLQRGVNRLLYGQREEPYAVLSELGRRLETTLSPDETLSTIAETVAQTLKLPYVSVALREGETETTAASIGAPTGRAITLPLSYQGEAVGALLLCPRAADEGWTTKERRLLDDLAHQAGIAVHAVRLHAELRQAHERMVLAREEERRRLRRDLHDGLGPQLASQTLTLSAARKLVRSDPDATESLLGEALRHAQTAIADIRHLVHGLRPPALDDLGLAGALREQAAQYTADGLRVVVEMPEQLPPLPAAVEVAVFRIAQEALTNVARHAQAHSATLRLTRSDVTHELSLEVVDDGCGLRPDRHAGVGLASMRERAIELGGTCVIDAVPSGGTRVLARLPLVN
jgi:signal transduction histidine kinase